MKRIRYLSMLALLLCSAAAWGQSGFNPDSPDEPGLPATRLVLRVSPSEAGYTSGSGRYVPASTVSVRAYAYDSFTFVKWTDNKGNVVSDSQYFSFTKTERADTLTANFIYDPESPADPKDTKLTLYYNLSILASDGGSVSGGGRYLQDASVALRAYPNDGYDFDGWYDGDGNKVSSSASFNYTMPSKATTLTGRFLFNPDNPSEPKDPGLRPKHWVMATAEDGGYTNISSVRTQEGTAVYLEAECNTGYIFDGWYIADTLYTKVKRFSYTVGNSDVSFVAKFHFEPDSPSEPSSATSKGSAFYLMNVVGKPGDTVKYPVYLNSLTELKDMTLQLTFDPRLQPRLDSVRLSKKAEGYTVSYSEVNDTVYAFSFIGGSYPVTNSALVTFDVVIPETMSTGKSYPVKINQVSVTIGDGSTATTSTRNGRISVYKLGDTNGDDEVNATDVLNISMVAVNKETEVFIKEVSDINGDDGINASDVLGVSEIAAADD